MSRAIGILTLFSVLLVSGPERLERVYEYEPGTPYAKEDSYGMSKIVKWVDVPLQTRTMVGCGPDDYSNMTYGSGRVTYCDGLVEWYSPICLSFKGSDLRGVGQGDFPEEF